MSGLLVNFLNYAHNKLFAAQSKAILFFFSTLPLAYAMQVISGLPQVAVISYLGLFCAVTVSAFMEFEGKIATKA